MVAVFTIGAAAAAGPVGAEIFYVFTMIGMICILPLVFIDRVSDWCVDHIWRGMLLLFGIPIGVGALACWIAALNGAPL